MPSPGIEILPLHLKQQPLDFQPTICPPASDFLPVGPTLSRLFPRVRGHCGLQAGSPPDPAAGEVSPLQRPALAPGHVCVVQDQHPGCPRTPPTARTCLRRPSQGSLAQGRIPLYPQMPVVCPHPGPYPEPWLLPGSWILHQIKVLKPLPSVGPLRLLSRRTVAPLTRTPRLLLQMDPEEGEQKKHEPGSAPDLPKSTAGKVSGVPAAPSPCPGWLILTDPRVPAAPTLLLALGPSHISAARPRPPLRARPPVEPASLHRPSKLRPREAPPGPARAAAAAAPPLR